MANGGLSFPTPSINAPFAGGGGRVAPGFWEALLGGFGQGQQNALAWAQMALQQQEQDRLLRESELRQENARAAGGALRDFLVAVTGGGPPLTTIQGAPVVAEPGGPRMTLEGIGAAQQAIGRGQEAAAVRQAAGPLGMLAEVARRAPAQAVPGLVEQAQPLMKMQAEARAQADRLVAIEQAIGAVPQDKQAGVRSLFTFAEMGWNLPKEMQATLFPDLFPALQGVDPERMRGVVEQFRTGSFTWGESRRAWGIPPTEGVPDDVRFVRPTLGLGGEPREMTLRQAAQYNMMVAQVPILNEFSERRAPSFLGQWIKEGGSPEGLNRLLTQAGRHVLSEDERVYIDAARRFVGAWVFIASGAQATDREFGRYMQALTETDADGPKARQLKRLMRDLMIQSGNDVTQGVFSSVQALERMLQREEWLPAQKAVLQEELERARMNEANVRAGRVPDPNAASPTENFEQLNERLNNLGRALEFMFQEGQERRR